MNCKGAIDIQVKTSASDYVTGLTAKNGNGQAGFDVSTSTTATSLFTTSTTGTYYVAVPAGVQLSVKDGSTTIKSTGTNGLTAGKYYELAVTDPDILTFIAKQNNSTIKIDIDGTLYKTSTQDWKDYPQNQAITLSAGQFVQFKAASGSTRNVIYKKFVMTGSFAASGSVMSLLGEGQNMGENAFRDLFDGCSSLTAAPALPATTLAEYCYYGMFWGCSSLTAAPALPATTLAVRCYQNMFTNCSKLTAAPALPATTLANYCYAYMFSGCSSLTAAPDLPASTLVNGCYRNMFQNCSNLKSINVNFTIWETSDIRLATTNWVQGVSAEGTFTCPAGLPEEHADNRIPTGWTVVRK